MIEYSLLKAIIETSEFEDSNLRFIYLEPSQVLKLLSELEQAQKDVLNGKLFGVNLKPNGEAWK